MHQDDKARDPTRFLVQRNTNDVTAHWSQVRRYRDRLVRFLVQLHELAFKLDDALKVYEAVAKSSPTAAEGIRARVRMGAIYLQQGRKDEAVALAEASAREAPDNSAASVTTTAPV